MRTLFIVVVIDILGFGILIPLVPYMADRFGVTPALITPILGIYSLCQLIAAPLWGRLSDRYGRRPILMSARGARCSLPAARHLVHNASPWTAVAGCCGFHGRQYLSGFCLCLGHQHTRAAR